MSLAFIHPQRTTKLGEFFPSLMFVKRSFKIQSLVPLVIWFLSSQYSVSSFAAFNPVSRMPDSKAMVYAPPSTLTYRRPKESERFGITSLASSRRGITPSQKRPSRFSAAAGSLRSMCTLPFCRSCPPPINLTYCGMVTNPDVTSSDDSDSESSVDSIKSKTSWKDKLLQFSNFASMLCVLDCTILPIVTVLFPLMGVLVSASHLEWLHQAGHAVALGFVLPVGGMATVTNYLYNHRTKWITAIGWLGLLLVGSANAGCSLVPHGTGGAMGHFLHEMLHTLHHGVQHRVANLAGCALLLFSNYLSRQKAAEKATCSGGSGCNHSHH